MTTVGDVRPRFSVAAVVHDRGVADRLLTPSLDALDEPTQELLLSNTDGRLGTNLAELYNFLGRLDGPAVRAFVHSDVSFPHDLVERVMSAIEQLENSRGTVGSARDGRTVVGRRVRLVP